MGKIARQRGIARNLCGVVGWRKNCLHEINSDLNRVSTFRAARFRN